jgi:glycosyltransferase involved in cell wall biosynthesis
MQSKLPQAIADDGLMLCHFTNAIAPLRHPCPFILTIHDASLFLFRQYHPASRLLAMRLLLPRLARGAEAIITPSETARRDVIRVLRLPPQRVHVVYEAPPDRFAPVDDRQELERIKRVYRLPPQFILYVGTIEPRKNLARLVAALAILHRQGYRLPLILVGPMGWRINRGLGRAGFDEEIEAQGMRDYVRYLGYVPTEHLPGLYSLATVFVFPSLYEGFGLPVVEAMACGAPVVTSRDTAMAEISAGAAVLADPLNVHSIAAGLRDIVASPDRRAELSRDGLQRVRRFSWSRAAAETTAIYHQVMRAPA